MSEAEKIFSCKEPGCDQKVAYVPQAVKVYRLGGKQKKSAPAPGSVVRVYLDCPKKHCHEYAVRV